MMCRQIRTLLAAMAMLIFVAACSGTQVVDQWKAEGMSVRKPNRIAVIAVLPEALMRQAIEMDIVDMMKKEGANAVAGSKLPGLSGGIRGEIDTVKAEEALKQSNVDGVVVIFYSGAMVVDEYERSDYWMQHVGSGFTSYGWGSPSFTNVYTVRQGPGYADKNMAHYVESTYFDVAVGKPVWRIVTKSSNTEYFDTGAEIGAKIVAQMTGTGLI